MRAQAGVYLALIIGLLVVPCTSCTDDDDDADTPSGASGLSGFTSVPPSIEGTWNMSSSIVSSTCGTLGQLYSTGTLRLDATQVGNDVGFAVQDACARPLPSGEGRVDQARVVTLTSEELRVLSATCTLKLVRVRTGTAAVPPDEMHGSDVLQIIDAAVDGGYTGAWNCGVSLPCTVDGTFAATRCPRSGCDLTCAD